MHHEVKSVDMTVSVIIDGGIDNLVKRIITKIYSSITCPVIESNPINISILCRGITRPWKKAHLIQKARRVETLLSEFHSRSERQAPVEPVRKQGIFYQQRGIVSNSLKGFYFVVLSTSEKNIVNATETFRICSQIPET